MEHADALREMSVEKYLLGELTGRARDDFEEHLFECSMCAADVQSGVLFAEAARPELAAEPRRVLEVEKKQGWFASLLRPQWMAPALAACLLLIGYQSAVRIPGLEQKLKQADGTGSVENLSFSAGATRGAELPHLSAPQHGRFELSVDLPPQPEYMQYVFSLVAPSGATVWKETLPQAKLEETEHFIVGTAITQAGRNIFLVQGVRAGTPGATMDELQRHEFLLDVTQ